MEQRVPTYDYTCESCGAVIERERAVDARDDPAPCPVCGGLARRAPSRPRLLFKGDPADNRPYWHNHDGYSHAHAPRRGRHRAPEEDH
jgi:putative FmdB family regulatory protein